MHSRTILYIALTATGQLRAGLTKDLTATARKLRDRQAGLIKAVVYFEEYVTLREAASRLVQIRQLSPSDLLLVVKEFNPALSDVSGEFTPVAATSIDLMQLLDDWYDEGDQGGGVFARLRRGPVGPIRPKFASYEQGFPELWEREEEYRTVFGS